MRGVEHRTVTEQEAGLRLDRWFKRHFPGLSFGRLAKLLRNGQVRVDGRRAKAGQRLEAGQAVRLPPLQAEAAKPVPAEMPAAAEAAALHRRVLYRDDWVIALDKPAGLAVQGGSGVRHHLDQMLDALRFGSAERPRLVHRLDKDTSGVLLLARHPLAAQRLAAAFRGKDAEKLYWAAVVGVPRREEGRIAAPLAKLPSHAGERVRTDEAGRSAVTLYRVLDKAGKRAAWLALRPLTGRTHQLRAHCALIGTPILGDGKYGGKGAFLSGRGLSRRLHLHARAIRLPHPSGRGELRVTAPLPEHMRDTWAFLGFDPEVADAAIA